MTYNSFKIEGCMHVYSYKEIILSQPKCAQSDAKMSQDFANYVYQLKANKRLLTNYS